MKLRPTIFLSGVSSEFASFRDAAEIEIQKKGCFPLNQPSFEIDYREIEDILRRNISEADALIHIVGFRFGLEPKGQPAGKSRRSYTQLEYDIARELNIPVYVFLSVDANVRDHDPGEQPEEAETVALQLGHRETLLQASNKIRYTFSDKNHFCTLIAGIPLLATADFRVDISRIVEYAPAELIGREDELALLNDAWLRVRHKESRRPHILTFVALGGEGKTSLVAKWAAQLAYENWPGCDSAFAWSFYSQGTREQYAGSSDLFLKEAITFFGNEEDREFAASSAGAYEKGQRLARIMGQRRALLILDGLEPLQYSPTAPTPGELKDLGISALVKGLAAYNSGLCVVTTRYSLPNLKTYWQTTAPEIPLTRLSKEAGVHLLKTLGVRGSHREFETLIEDVKGHALTLNLLGTYLRDAHGGDIRRRDLVKLEEADAEEQGGHAFRVMEAYEHAFENEGEKGRRSLAILRLFGLFDRPVSADCLGTLLKEPAIVGLTDPVVQLTDVQCNVVLKRLEDAKLVSVNREASSVLAAVDAHPLLREYFAGRIRSQQTDAWREAHRRVYQHLCENTPDKEEPTLEDLQPLYQAMAHGCQAGLQEDVVHMYDARIKRDASGYVSTKLGAFGSDLAALAHFFDKPWSKVSTALSEHATAWILAAATYRLRALGRLTEAIEPMRVALSIRVKQAEWGRANTVSYNLSQLQLMLGRITDAVRSAEQSVSYADLGGEPRDRAGSRSAYADALHHAGLIAEANRVFHETEQIQKLADPSHPFLYSASGFHHWDLLLSTIERDVWLATVDHAYPIPFATGSLSEAEGMAKAAEPRSLIQNRSHSKHSKTLRLVSRRVRTPLEIAERNNWLLDIARGHLVLGRIGLYGTLLADNHSRSDIRELKVTMNAAVNGVRRAGTVQHLPGSLLSRAWFRILTGATPGPDSAQEDLDEAWEIAERGPMKLCMADIHLYRARLFFREENYPWGSAQEDLEAAERLIHECGYHRRDEELADAKRVILGQSA